MLSTRQLGVTVAAVLFISTVAGHGYMQTPKGRTTNAFGDAKDEATCDSDQSGEVTEYKAGEEIEVVWVRNNHIGGFIRYSLVPKDDVSKDNFDKNAFFYTCRESQCSLQQCNDKFCGDDASAGDNGITCRAKIKLPDYLQKGDYVLQWTWHAAGSSYGKIGWSTSNFKTCADIRLTTSGEGEKPKCPTFVGGDRVTMMDKDLSDEERTTQCFYFAENGLGKDFLKYDDDEGYKRYVFGVPKEIDECGGGATPGNSTLTEESDDEEPAKVKPAEDQEEDAKSGDNGGGNKGEWEFCSSNDECINRCCSNKFSGDGKMKCTPNGC